MNEREALSLALEALKTCQIDGDGWSGPDYWFDSEKVGKAITAIKQALAQPEQEPVAVVDANDDGYWAEILPDRDVKVGQFLYANPPQRKPLTNEEIGDLDTWLVDQPFWRVVAFARAIEAAHGIKGEA